LVQWPLTTCTRGVVVRRYIGRLARCDFFDRGDDAVSLFVADVQDLVGTALSVFEDGDEQMLRANVLVMETERYPEALFENCSCVASEGNVSFWAEVPRVSPGLNFLADVGGRAELLKLLISEDVRFGERDQEMVCPDMVVVKLACLFLGPHDDMARFGREPLKHRSDDTRARSGRSGFGRGYCWTKFWSQKT